MVDMILCDINNLQKEAITTQHRVLIAELEVKATRKRRVEERKLIRWWKLKNNEVREQFRRSVVERMANTHNRECRGMVGRDCGVDQVLWRGSMREVIWEEETGTGELVVERRDR